MNRDMEINQDTEAQHHTQYIAKTSLEYNNYIVKYTEYTPT